MTEREGPPAGLRLSRQGQPSHQPDALNGLRWLQPYLVRAQALEEGSWARLGQRRTAQAPARDNRLDLLSRASLGETFNRPRGQPLDGLSGWIRMSQRAASPRGGPRPPRSRYSDHRGGQLGQGATKDASPRIPPFYTGDAGSHSGPPNGAGLHHDRHLHCHGQGSPLHRVWGHPTITRRAGPRLTRPWWQLGKDYNSSKR